MKKRMLVTILSSALVFSTLTACGNNAGVQTEQEVAATTVAEESVVETETVEEVAVPDVPFGDYPSLKELYADYFEIGVCINPTIIAAKKYSDLTLREFSSATCENDMKPEAIFKMSESMKDIEDGGTHLVVNFDKAEKELAFAEENGLKMRGHTLIWHEQTPNWIFYKNYDVNGELADRELMLTRLDNYMHDVFEWAETNHPGLFYAWDVVNEAVDDSGKMREDLWYQTIGEDYVVQAFHYANMYAPESIKLFYNDYNAYKPGKQRGIIDMLTPAAEAGDIDGVGMQAHLYTGEAPSDFTAKAKKYADELGVVIHITEIDVSQPEGNSPEGIQGKYYGDLFYALRKAKESGVPVESVTVWGLTDGLSWKKSEKPLMFNDDFTGKNAFYEVVEAATRE